MARRRGARRLTHPSGVAQPIDGVRDVGPSTVVPAAAAAPATAQEETLEDRQERWFRERERFEKRRAAAEPPSS